MNIKFEHGRDHDMDTVEDAVKPKEVAKVNTDVSDKKALEKAEKVRLQTILNDAGVTYAKTLGSKKLQLLVDELPKEPVE